MRNALISLIEKEKLIVIVRGVEREKLIPLAKALYEGGVRLMEITYDASDTVSDETTAENIALLAESFRGRMYIGAGTVLTEKQVALTKDAGGCFIISPDTNDAVIRKTRELDMVSIPGALTPTEVMAAHRAGADFVKLFPAGALGASYLRAITAPLSHIRFLAVGGIHAQNIAEYRRAGACGFGVGSAVTNTDMAADSISALAKTYVDAAKGAV